MREETYRCDVCKAEIETTVEGSARKSFQHVMQTIFATEQSEGYPHKPYFCNNTLDLCPTCYDWALGGHYIFGKRAQGYNKYFFCNTTGEA